MTGRTGPREAVAIEKALRYFPGTPRGLPTLPPLMREPPSPRTVRNLVQFIRSGLGCAQEQFFKGYAVGLSGGVDSATCLALVKAAVGRTRTKGVIVDLGLNGHAEQSRTGREVAALLGVGCVVIRNRSVYPGFLGASARRGPFSEINAVTRAIHGLVFQFADSRQWGVVSTLDRSEELLSRHLELFYGHVAPLGRFYKTEVMRIAELVGVPRAVISREPGCVEAWLDREVFGVGYDVLDPLLFQMVERRMTPEQVFRRFGGDLRWLRAIQRRLDQARWRMSTRVPLPPRGTHTNGEAA